MKRWFNSSKSYELSAEQQTRGSNRESKTKATSPEVKVVGASPLLSKKSEAVRPNTLEKNGEASLAITVKETTVESAKRSHRRQKSSGNWQMLLGETNKPSPTSTLESQKADSDNGASQTPSPRPVQVPVSCKETRPLSFFQKISVDDEPLLRQEAKPKKSEIFPWGESQTPSPSPSNDDSKRFKPIVDSSPDVSDRAPSIQSIPMPAEIATGPEDVLDIRSASDERKKLKDYKTQLSHISQSLEDDPPQEIQTDYTDTAPTHIDNGPVVEDCIDSVTSHDEQDQDLSEHNVSNYCEDISISSMDDVTNIHATEESIDEPLIPHVHDNVSTAPIMPFDNSTSQLESLDETVAEGDKPSPPKQFPRAIHELEHHHVKRNSDPLSVKKKRRQSASKRKSFPLTVGDSMDSSSEMKCEVLKISTVDIDVVPLEDETFVLVDPALQNVEGHVRRVSVKSFSDVMSEEPEVVSDTESEIYRLAMATSETLIDTTTSEDSLNSADPSEVLSIEMDYERPKMDLLHAALPMARLRRSVYNSNNELSSLANIRSLDESSICESDRGSQHSFKSSLSNKSYSVNDLTMLERPAGFGTLDMNRLVGSLQMLDSILSEHTAATPDDESLPPLPSSPVSATIRIGLEDDEDEDSQSVKSLTIIRTSSEELSSSTTMTNPAQAVSGITIQVDRGGTNQTVASQVSPVSAVISIGGDGDDVVSLHNVSDDVIKEEAEEQKREEPETSNAQEDEEDTVMPLPSDVIVSSSNQDPGVKSSSALGEDNSSSSLTVSNNREPFQLPWGARRAHNEGNSEEDRPGAFVLRKLFTDFTRLAGRKIEQVLAEPLERPLQKSLQRGEDTQLDQLLSTLNAVAEHCLPSLLKTLFAWYERQVPHKAHKPKNKGNKDVLSERRDLAVDFLFCLVLIEILKQLNFHPGYDDLIDKIIQMSFSHFKLNDSMATNPNAHNLNTLADLSAEVLGVLAKSRFIAVKRKFLIEMRDLRGKEQNQGVTNQIISLVMGLKFFRVKMHPIEEFEACTQFLHDLGAIFIETKDREIKHALAGLFVEIMLPMAAIVQTEVNVPVLRNFVEKMYPVAYDLATRKRNTLALFPMVTCLLCVSQKTFFIAQWPIFLNYCVQNLKNRDAKISRVALESLYRLVWVYMIRVKCEANAATSQKLGSIVSCLFPKNQKGVIPRDTPLNIYVKIIQFIAREKLDFAMRDVIFDLLSAGKKNIVILPERMSIGLRAFLVISDNLQQKDGEPPMPQTVGVMPSGSTLRPKKTFLNKVLTDESAKNIGIHGYYPQVRKAFSNILRLLDGQIGKVFMMTKPENKDKDLDELIGVDKKPKLDLLRTCVAAIPRLMPSNDLSVPELVEMLLRYTVHIDEELRGLAYKALENTLNNFWETRDIILSSLVNFIQHDIPDIHPQLVDNALRMLHSLMCHWKSTAINPNTAHKNANVRLFPMKGRAECIYIQKQAIHQVEGLGLVMLCSCRTSTRKVSVSLLKEAHNLMKEIFPEEVCVITAIDKEIPKILETILPYLPQQEKTQVLFASSGTLDLQWLVDQTSKVWFSGYGEESLSRIANHNMNFMPFDAWVEVISGILSYDYMKANFAIAAYNAWPIVYSRLTSLYPLIDPNNTANEQRSSGLLRGNKKLTNERDVYINLWHNYIVFACCVAPSGAAPHQSTQHDLSSSPESNQSGSDSRPPSAVSLSSETGQHLFRLLIPLLKCEITELRDSCITALGRCSPEALHELGEELTPTIKDVIDRRQENVRRRKKKDSLRLNVCRLFHLLASNKIFAHRFANVIDLKRQTLMSMYIEFIDGCRLMLESEATRDDLPIVQDIRLHYSSFITHLIKHSPAEYKDKLLNTELRYTLFNLLSSWSKSLGHMVTTNTSSLNWPYRTETFTDLELSSLEAMAAVLGCGKIFDPTGISENDGYIYPWLDRLLSCCDPQVNRIGQETCQHLLRYNGDIQYLLDWTIDRCYRGTPQVADACFTTLVKVFSHREYPCDSVAMLNLSLLYCGCPRIHIREMAAQLLVKLCKRFLLIDEAILPASQASNAQDSSEFSHTLEDVMNTAFCKTQFNLSQELTRLNPELTIQIFSEVCQRIDTAVPSIRHNMFSYLSPWLLNIELVNPQIPNGTFLPPTPKSITDTLNYNSSAEGSGADRRSRTGLQGHGWGSCQASEMVLNNMMYLTVRFGDEHAEAVEILWQELSSAFSHNLRFIVKYLLILTGISPNRLLPYVKRVFVYLARRQSRLLVDEVLTELQCVETLPFTVERTNTSPYFRMMPIRSARSAPSADTQTDADSMNSPSAGHRQPAAADYDTELTLTAEEGVIFAKKLSEINPKPQPYSDTGAKLTTQLTQDNSQHKTSRAEPFPLPMPAFGGYHAPLCNYMPADGPLAINNLQRCFLSLCAISDLFIDNQHIDWTMHMPTLLQVAILGCDHAKSLVYDHCKKIILSLILCVLDKSDHILSQVLESLTLLHSSIYGNTSVCKSPSGIYYQLNPKSALNSENTSSLKVTHSTLSITSICTLTPESESQPLPASPVTIGGDNPSSPLSHTGGAAGRSKVVKQAVENVVHMFKNRENRPLWSYETVTPRQKDLKSLVIMNDLLTHLVSIFKQCLPQSLIDLRWCQTSLQFAMSCPSRHYAGRSLQVFRLIGIPMNTQMLSEITSRLVEVVCETAEEMQGFVTEILQTIEKAVSSLDIGVIGLTFYCLMTRAGTDNTKDLFISTPNLKSSERVLSTGMLGIKKSTTGGNLNPAAAAAPPSSRSHKRSTSVSISSVTKRAAGPPSSNQHHGAANSSHSPAKIRPLSEFNPASPDGVEGHDDSITDDVRLQNIDEKLSTLVQMFWLGASLLESDYEYEFLLAVNLLKQVLNYLKPDRLECREKMEKTLKQLKWLKFPGLHGLVVKGLTSAQTCNDTWTLLSQLTLCISAPVISHSETLGFPVNVMCLLPYMVQHYEEPTPICTEAADNIAQMALEISNKLDNLATVMRLYSRGTFGKDAHQWTKCVVKYLTDIYETEHLHVITLLLEVLEQGTASTQAAILLILHCTLHYIDINSLPSPTMASDLIYTVSKFVEGPHWNEAQKILKLAVKSSSHLIPVNKSPYNGNGQSAHGGSGGIQGLASLHTHTSFAEAEILVRKDLPGRTLDFSFDVSSTPVIGERFLHPMTDERNVQPNSKISGGKQNGPTLSSPSVSSADSTGNWRRPHHSQPRVRERFVCLLATLGQRVGVIKSPSVIFSQVSEPVDRQMSMCSSSEETGSITDQDKTQEDSSVSDQFGDQYFKDFDFLDNETEHIDDEVEDQFNWGVKRQHSINELDMTEVTKQDIMQRMNARKAERGNTQETESSAKSTDDEGGDEPEQSASPVDEVLTGVVPPTTLSLSPVAPLSPPKEEDMTIIKGDISDNTESIHSNCSDTETGGYLNNTCTSNEIQTFLSLTGDEVEENWTNHVTLIMTSSATDNSTGSDDAGEGVTLVNMYTLFNRLFKEKKRKLSNLTKEVCFYLSKTPSLRSISSQFMKTLEILITQAECPFTYIDTETASSVRMTDTQKFTLLELHEAYLTYLDRKELALESLENIKSSIKMQSLGTHVSDFCGDEQRMELCNSLYRLQFQLVVLYTDYMRLITSLKQTCDSEEVLDMSGEVAKLASDLQQAVNTVETDPSSPCDVDTNEITKSDAEENLVEMLTSDNKRLVECISYIRSIRQVHPGDLFGVSSHDDVAACMSIYCKNKASHVKNGLLVIARRASADTSSLSKQLLELKLQLNTVLKQLSQTAKVEVIHQLAGATSEKSLQVLENKTSTSPTSAKSRPLSPRFIPIDTQTPASPKSQSAQVSPVGQANSAVGNVSASPSNSEEDRCGAQKLPDTVVASSAL